MLGRDYPRPVVDHAEARAATLARYAVVMLVAVLLRPTRERLPAGWTTALTWGGLRGALSMVLALALPLDFPHRAQIVAMTFGVVLLSLVLQGMSMSWLFERLGFAQPARATVELEN